MPVGALAPPNVGHAPSVAVRAFASPLGIPNGSQPVQRRILILSARGSGHVGVFGLHTHRRPRPRRTSDVEEAVERAWGEDCRDVFYPEIVSVADGSHRGRRVQPSGDRSAPRRVAKIDEILISWQNGKEGLS